MTARTAALPLAAGWSRRRVAIAALLLALLAATAWRVAGGGADRPPVMPTSPQLESQTGVRFTQARMVADGGIVQLTYLVLDAEKAGRFQSDTKHPPRLVDEGTGQQAWRTALMKQGHELRPGQTYFILYENTRQAIRSGGQIAIDAGKIQLRHVPVR